MFTIAVDVGGPEKIGWACSDGTCGTGKDIGLVLKAAADTLDNGRPVSLGFEAPIWTPRRDDLKRITSRRQGAEITFNRAWSAGAGCGVLAAGLGLMPWCFSQLASLTDERRATTSTTRFRARPAGLFVWEAFVSGAAKALTHHDDATLALAAFQARTLDEPSDVPGEAAVNLAVAALLATGWHVDLREIAEPGHVIAAGLNRDAVTELSFPAHRTKPDPASG